MGMTEGAALIGNTWVTTVGANRMLRQLRVDVGLTGVLERSTGQLSIPVPARLESLRPLEWWEWGKIVGLVGLTVLVFTLFTGHVLHPAVTAVLLHVTADFTFQTAETVRRKVERGRHLLIHALVAGGLPLAIAGFVIGNHLAVLSWVTVGAMCHYAVDWTRKFGVQQVSRAVALDQACHLLVILALALGTRLTVG